MSEVRETAHNKQLKFKLSIKNCISIPFKHFQIARPEMHRSASQLSTLSGGWKLNSIIHQHKDEQQIEILPFAAMILCNFSALCYFIFKAN